VAAAYVMARREANGGISSMQRRKRGASRLAKIGWRCINMAASRMA